MNSLVKKALQLMVVLGVISSMNAFAAEEEFPGRKLFESVNVLELDEFHQNLDKYTVVDARTKYEYKVLHIEGALHVDLGDRQCVEKIRALHDETGKPLVFYCNGHTCYKSYKIAAKAYDGGIQDVSVYDAGVLNWLKAYPEQSTLLGETPADTRKLISEEDFRSHLLSAKEFASMVHAGGHKTLDIRGLLQRRSGGLFIVETNIPLDDEQAMNSYLDRIKSENQSLLIYDMAGKQIRWFQYELKKRGIRDYHFLEGGVRGFIQSTRKKK
ncbi:MAG: hypothetical protein KZQ58_12390 [gamma proteobacterium symbiont of Bathyaustriella thionipta]|nr:hypothetical protein [gamma proteobacterium symbiont of Bathyaustriella thionipta]